MREKKRAARWYFGGLASAGAACCTHPLDLVKVHLQTQQQGKMSLVRQTVLIVNQQGIGALYSGLTASLLRQLTYSTTRFGIYEVTKKSIGGSNPDSIPFYQKAFIAGFSGAVGGLVGTPGDLVNVRMQNDIKLPVDQRRNYKHAIDGVIRVYKEEGVRRLFSGASTASSRAVLMTIGQLSFYDQIKISLINSGYFSDNTLTHVTASLAAVCIFRFYVDLRDWLTLILTCFQGAIATTMTQPLDVIKTRAMNAKPGEFKNMMHLITYTARLGPMGFFKGYIPAFVRLGPQTILTFVFFEQLRKNFGDIV